ncbi:MAG: RMD1 family protein [Polyangiales bacterium]
MSSELSTEGPDAQAEPALPFVDQQSIRVRALFLGQRIDARPLEEAQPLALAPLVIPAGTQGLAVVFRYGVVVLFHLQPVEQAAFLRHLATLVTEAHPEMEQDEVEIRCHAEGREHAHAGIVHLQRYSLGRLQVVADILAKSVVLAHYEDAIAAAFDKVEPLAAELERHGKAGRSSRELLRHIGRSLQVQTTMVARVEVTEKPELLWEHPELEMLYARLEDEYELSERHLALERKLALVSRTAETLLDLLQHGRSLRVEWYIVGLILLEILLTLFGFALHR